MSILGNSLTISHPRDSSGRLTKKENHRTSTTAHQSAFNLASMKRSLSGTNYNSLLGPLLQPSSSTGLEDRPPPPPAPTQMQDQHKRPGIFTRLQSDSNQFPSGFSNSENINKYGMVENMQKAGGIDRAIPSRRSDERSRHNLAQPSSSAHQSMSNNLTSTSVQQRLHQIQQSNDVRSNPEGSMTVTQQKIV